MAKINYQLIEESVDITKLLTNVMKNAEYKRSIKEATDPFITELALNLNHLRIKLEKIIELQKRFSNQ